MDQKIKDSDLKIRGFVSTLSLFFQSGYSAFLGLVANLILTILLSPKIFGIYILTLSIISFLNYFSDVGLAASLIQKKELKEDDIKTVFTTQQIIILTLILIGFFGTSVIQKFYQLPKEGVYLYWALLASFFISSLKTIPSVLLERKIQFQKIVLVSIVENTVFYIAVSVFALLGFSLNSFTIAVILRSIVGLILIYSLSFWLPKIGISINSLKQLLSFGLPYQASSYLALFKDDFIILYLGKVIGFEGVGYIGWAKKWAEAPIRIVMDNVSKVLFPLIARFQDNLEKIGRLIEKILYYQTALLAPTMLGMAIVMEKFVDVIPNYNKWQTALPLFYIFVFSSLIISFTAPLMNVLNALGKVKITFSFMLFFTILTWILTPYLTARLGYFGFPIAHMVVSISFFAVLLRAKKIFRFNFIKSIYKFLISAMIMTFVLLLIQQFTNLNTNFLITVLVVVGAFTYYIVLRSFFGVKVRSEVKSLYHNE